MLAATFCRSLKGFRGIYVTVEAAPAAVRNLFTSCPAVAASRDSPLFTAPALVPSPPAPASASVSGCRRKEKIKANVFKKNPIYFKIISIFH